MSTRTRWQGPVCILSAVVLLGIWLRPRQTTVVVLEPVDASILNLIVFEGFSEREIERILAALLPKLGGRCVEAMNGAGLRSLEQVIRETGLTIKHSRFLYLRSAKANKLADERLQDKYKDDFSTGRAQAGTIPPERSGRRLTTDGRTYIYLHDSAFLGDSFLALFLGWHTLEDLLTHELIHAGGQPPTPGLLGPVQHDLAGYEHYERVMDACR
jgi:hypothetical protein